MQNKMPEETLIINYISIERSRISVGVTDKEKWNREIEEGFSGADAATYVFCNINFQSDTAPLENIELSLCGPSVPIRDLILKSIPQILEIAWKIKHEKLKEKSAREKYFGYEIKN